MNNLLLNRKTDKDFDEIKNKKFALIFRLLLRIMKNFKALTFFTLLITLVVLFINYRLSLSSKNFSSFQLNSEEVSSKVFLARLFSIIGSEEKNNILGFIAKVFFPLIVLKSVFSNTHIYLNKYISTKVENDLKFELFKLFIDSKYQNSSKISSKIFTQFSSSIEEISEPIWSIPNRTFYVVISMIVYFYYDVNQKKLILFPLALTLFFCFGIVYYLLDISTKEKTKIKKRNEETTRFIFERIRNLSHIKMSSSEEFEKIKLKKKLDEDFSKNRKSFVWTVFLEGLPRYFIIPSIPYVITYIKVFFFSSNKSISVGNAIFQFLTYRSLCSEFEKMIDSFVKLDSLFSEMTIIYESVGELSESEITSNKEDQSLGLFDHEIAFKNLSFSYPLRPEIKVINGLNFKFESGKKYGIAGKNGAGKSTITKVILKLFDPLEGEVLISGKNIRDLKKDSLHEQVCRLTNSPSFFNMSILENIFYPFNYSSDHEQNEKSIELLWKAAEKVKIDKFISSLPNGFNTVIRESGSDLSEGQKQQIEAMKVFVRPYNVYVLDEILSNVHPETRSIVLENIFNEIKGKIAIVIDHHYDIFKYMDEVYNFSKSELKKIKLEDINKISEEESDE